SRLPIAVGSALFGATLIVLSRVISIDVAVWELFPWITVGGLGYGLVMAPITTVVVGAVPPERSGVASGLMQSARQLGGALGGAIVAGYTSGVAIRTPQYGLDFTSGLKTAMVFAGVAALGVTAISLTLVKRRTGAESLGEAGLGTAPHV